MHFCVCFWHAQESVELGPVVSADVLKSIGEGDTGFRAKESDSLMMTALRFSQLHPDEWRQYVRRWNLDGKKLRRVYGVE